MIMSFQILFFLAFVSAVTRVASAQEPVFEPVAEPIASQTDNEVSIENGGINERLFKQYFTKRRKEHLSVVRDMRKVENYEKRYKMVSILAENSFNIVDLSRDIIKGVDILAGNGEALKNLTIRHAITTILENCALFGDVILQLPDITQRVMKGQKNWNATLQWGLDFVNTTRHLLDEPTITMFDLVRQELKIVPRHPNYSNKYWPKKAEDPTNDKNIKKKKSSGKLKKNKGPRMVNIEL